MGDVVVVKADEPASAVDAETGAVTESAAEVTAEAAVEIAAINAEKEVAIEAIRAETREVEAEALARGMSDERYEECQRQITDLRFTVATMAETLTTLVASLTPAPSETPPQNPPAMEVDAGGDAVVIAASPEAAAEKAEEPPKREKGYQLI